MSVEISVLGRLCQSRSGRDSGRFYIVCKELGGGYIAVCDGEMRTLDSPKRKNLKHIAFIGKEPFAVTEGLKSGKATDVQIRTHLKPYNKPAIKDT